MTERGGGQREGERELQAFRAAEAMPGAVERRVWARLEASTAEPVPAMRPGRARVPAWGWAAVAVATAAALLLASQAGLIGPLSGARDGEAAAYAEAARAGRALTEPAREEERAGDRGEADRRDEGEDRSVAEETGLGVEVVGDRGSATSRPRPRGRAPQETSGPAPEAATEPRRAPQEVATESRSDGNQEVAVAPTSTLAQEAELLARVQAAIQDARAAEALTLLRDYAQRFPRGALSEEHDALRALALCAAGRMTEGRGAAKVFLSARGGSALAERVRRGCLDE